MLRDPINLVALQSSSARPRAFAPRSVFLGPGSAAAVLLRNWGGREFSTVISESNPRTVEVSVSGPPGATIGRPPRLHQPRARQHRPEWQPEAQARRRQRVQWGAWAKSPTTSPGTAAVTPAHAAPTIAPRWRWQAAQPQRDRGHGPLLPVFQGLASCRRRSAAEGTGLASYAPWPRPPQRQRALCARARRMRVSAHLFTPWPAPRAGRSLAAAMTVAPSAHEDALCVQAEPGQSRGHRGLASRRTE